MKYLFLLASCLVFSVFSQSSLALVNASAGRHVSGAFPGDMPVSRFIKMTARQIEFMTGKKMGLKERMSFFMLKMKMKKDLKKGKEVRLSDYAQPSKKLGAGWIALIVLGGILLILILMVTLGGWGDLV